MVFAPTAQEFAQQVAATRNHLVLTTLEHVQGRAYMYTRAKDGQWTRKKLSVPDNQTVEVVSASQLDDQFFLARNRISEPAFALAGRCGCSEL